VRLLLLSSCEFLLFLLDAILDVGFSLVPEYRAFAMVTVDNVRVVLHR